MPGSAPLSLGMPDPAGGTPCATRVLGTTRGVGCVQLGRVAEGELGALGQDGVAENDRRSDRVGARALPRPRQRDRSGS
ncbi:MAG TPA: hypothetical protein VH834_11385 [Solirubrobacteraceae bacterium]